MSTTEVSRQLRLLLESSPHAIAPADLYALVDGFVLECTASDEPEVLLHNLEDELQEIHRDSINHGVYEQTEIFLTVLRRLIPILSSTNLISTWFDLVLRPALREPRLPGLAVAHAKELVLAALEKPDPRCTEKQGEFRRRILDLYLLDAFNEGSGEDVIEWAELPEEQREKRDVWKFNLEDILVRFGLEQPEVSLNPWMVLSAFQVLTKQCHTGAFDTGFPLLRIGIVSPAATWPPEPIHFPILVRETGP